MDLYESNKPLYLPIKMWGSCKPSENISDLL